MASIIKAPTSKYWIAAFRDSSARQYRRTTRETDRKRAQQVADKYEFAAQAKGNSARVRRTLNEFLRDHYAEESPFVTARDFITQWIAARKAEVSPNTFRVYRESAEKFLAFLGENANRAMEDITKAQISAFRDALAAKHSSATVKTRLGGIKQIFRSARLDGCLLADPSESIKSSVRNNDASKRRAFTLDEINRILAVADEEWRSLVKFGLYTGQRLGDLTTLTWAQIDLERSEIVLTTRKTGKSLLIPMATPLYEHILSLPAADNPRDPVHPKAFKTYTEGHGSTLSNHFADILAAAGLREPWRSRSRLRARSSDRHTICELSFHSLRHTAVSLLKDAGVADAVVMALVGHNSVAMSARYTHVGRDALARAAQSLPQI